MEDSDYEDGSGSDHEDGSDYKDEDEDYSDSSNSDDDDSVFSSSDDADNSDSSSLAKHDTIEISKENLHNEEETEDDITTTGVVKEESTKYPALEHGGDYNESGENIDSDDTIADTLQDTKANIEEDTITGK